MSPIRGNSLKWSILISSILAASLQCATAAWAQARSSGASYRIEANSALPNGSQRDDTPSVTVQAATTDRSDQGPIRMARFASVSGNVTWRADDDAEWAPATINLPIQEGAQIWVNDGGRAALQFDDGSELRLGNGALAILKLLYSDAQGEFTQITLNGGLATLHARHDISVYQIDTPLVSVKTTGTSQIRFGVTSSTEVATQRGSAVVEGAQGKVTLLAGAYLNLANGDAGYKLHKLPAKDSWDRWNADRNLLLDGNFETDRYVPLNIGLVAGDLDQYGTWREDAKYGWVWVPRVASSNWRPYHDGRWVWVEPYGWTWVSNEPWGWAPYHYGTWIDQPYGWAWCPGPASQYWSPGVVDFAVCAGDVGWAPLCPWEVIYPAPCSLGRWDTGWCLTFSIGWAGCYYPDGLGHSVGRPWDNGYLNHYGHGHTGLHHSSDDHNAPTVIHGFVPYNARYVPGASLASAGAFDGRGGYRALPRGETTVFTRGLSIGPPVAGGNPLSGPASVQPTQAPTTADESCASTLRPPQAMLLNSIYHGPLPTLGQRSVPVTATDHSFESTAAEQARNNAAAHHSTNISGPTGRSSTSLQNRVAVNFAPLGATVGHNYATMTSWQTKVASRITHEADRPYSLNGRFSGANSSVLQGVRDGHSYGVSPGTSDHISGGSNSGSYGGNLAGSYRDNDRESYHNDNFGGGGSHGSFSGGDSHGGDSGGGSHGGGGHGR